MSPVESSRRGGSNRYRQAYAAALDVPKASTRSRKKTHFFGWNPPVRTCTRQCAGARVCSHMHRDMCADTCTSVHVDMCVPVDVVERAKKNGKKKGTCEQAVGQEEAARVVLDVGVFEQPRLCKNTYAAVLVRTHMLQSAQEHIRCSPCKNAYAAVLVRTHMLQSA